MIKYKFLEIILIIPLIFEINVFINCESSLDDLIKSREAMAKALALRMEELYAQKCELINNIS